MAEKDQQEAQEHDEESVLEQMQLARDTLQKSLDRLADTGYLMSVGDEDRRAALSAEGLTRLHDLLTVFVAQSAGDEMPKAFRMAHDVGAIFYLTLSSIMIAEDRSIGSLDLNRQAINQLRRAAREHK